MTPLPLLAVMAGSLGAALAFRWVRMPLWPLTGGLVGAAAVNLGFGLAAEVPVVISLTGQLLIGTAIGSTIGPEVFRRFLRILGPGTLAVTVVLGAGLLFGWLFAATGLMDPAESMLALVPGGVGEMVAAAIALDLDSAQVVGVQVVRILTVLLSLPLVFWVSEWIHRRWIAGPDDSAR
ncbi:AbrB family transcriptional regulator [Nocardiopsis sp. SBT366]|uniref:AbrB family transcriptional regulator n=1 Tax=Nocardiopsis sp. SBT366 TaxID=1580529 RepID=UPI00066A6B17|nr:AbrB family transcriptional regulator [Nocardiopsis sp. SBT366]